MSNNTILLKKGHYPWPDLISTHIDRMEKEYYGMVDRELAFMSESAREKFKRFRLDITTARMFPMPIAYERILPMMKFMLWITAFDDYYEYCSFKELDLLREYSLAVLTEAAEPSPDRHLENLIAQIRDEFSTFMPLEWMGRFAVVFNDFIQYGMLEEVSFKAAHTPPPLSLFLIFREYCIGMRPFIPFADVQMDYVLPKYIDNHPLLLRFKTLTARIIAWQNDLRSWPKEVGRETEVINTIFVLQRERNWSFEQANEEVFRMHNAAIAEFVELEKTMPYFGRHNEKVKEYLYLLGVMIQGLNSWYDDTERYLHGAKGYAEPEYKTTM